MRPGQLSEHLGPNVFHLIHLHAVLLSQSLGIMTYDELRSPDSPLCKHDVGMYVSKAGGSHMAACRFRFICSLSVQVTSVTSWLAWSAESSGAAGLPIRGSLQAIKLSVGFVSPPHRVQHLEERSFWRPPDASWDSSGRCAVVGRSRFLRAAGMLQTPSRRASRRLSRRQEV